jgi:ornithine cyclodeaminase/alanine dehydrogenase-like protein (mu-crystallin family)
MLFLTESDVMQLLPMNEAVGLMRAVFERLARGEAINQPRRRLIMPGGSALHYMAGSDGKYFGAKIYSTNPRFGAHFVFLLYRAEDAQLLAVIQANWLGQIRTGAVSGLATDLMARKDAVVAGMIGTGFQARSQIEATAAVRRLRRVNVWSRSAEKRNAFAGEYRVTLGIPVEAVDTAEEAVRDAEIVITATNAKDPVVEDAWISVGTHINAMGSNQAKRRELPPGLIARADCIAVDSKEQARMESGDLLLNMDEAGWQSERLVELADVVSGRAPGRSRDDQITIFKSVGLAIEDVISAGYVYERAVQAGLGRAVPVYS